tara:strand:- start:470 stop:892 length:423 start_codon:yes stop_codon:yes gene_type:complete
MINYEIDDKCPIEGCGGKVVKTELDRGCSCHINPPCSHCCNGQVECDTCDFEHDSMADYNPSSINTVPDKYIRKIKTFDDLKKGTFDYLTISGAYYFMVYKGYYPENWTADDLKSKFNICFGYTNFSMKDGIFNIKVYTD